LGELAENPQDLPETILGDELLPSLSRCGHRKLINKDKADLAARKAEYLAKCKCDPWNGVPVVIHEDDRGRFFDRQYWEQKTGLTGAALLFYLLLSEGSRIVVPARNLVPAP
jgi:hypothetical protein